MAANRPATGRGARASVEVEDSSNTAAADGAVVETLYHSQSPRLLRMLQRRLADREEARDMVQEIFARMIRVGHSKTAELDRPEAYLTRMARNLLTDRARVQHSGTQIMLEEGQLASGIDPITHLETRDMLRRIEAAMSRLKPKTRAIFMAHRLEGMSYQEIAYRHGISVKGVEKQMSKAIAQVDRALDRR